MWSGLLPPGVRESDLSEEEPEPGAAGGPGAETGEPNCIVGVPDSSYTKLMELQKKRLELKAQASRMEKRKSLRKRKHKEKTTGNQEMNNSPAPAKNSALDTLQPYFEASDRFEPPVCIKIIKKSRLEDAMDQAVKGGDIETAEELSDRLATREMAVKVTKAVSSYKYLQTKEKEEASQGSRQKKKNLGWGFEAKKRWETKSNMGYM